VSARDYERDPLSDEEIEELLDVALGGDR